MNFIIYRLCSVFTRPPYYGSSAHTGIGEQPIHVDGENGKLKVTASIQLRESIDEMHFWMGHFPLHCVLFFLGSWRVGCVLLTQTNIHNMDFYTHIFFCKSFNNSMENSIPLKSRGRMFRSSQLTRRNSLAFVVVVVGLLRWPHLLDCHCDVCGLWFVPFQVWITSSASQSFARCENPSTHIQLNKILTRVDTESSPNALLPLIDSRPSIN